MQEQENEKNQDSFYKEQFIKLGFFSAITVVLTGLLVFFTLVSRTSWRNGLKDKTNSVLEENGSELRADEWVRLSSNLTSQMAAFTVEGKGNESIYAVICRTQSLYGPAASVYTFDSAKNRTEFIGYADIPPKIKNALKELTEKNQNAYWEKKIPSAIPVKKQEGKE